MKHTVPTVEHDRHFCDGEIRQELVGGILGGVQQDCITSRGSANGTRLGDRHANYDVGVDLAGVAEIAKTGLIRIQDPNFLRVAQIHRGSSDRNSVPLQTTYKDFSLQSVLPL